MRGFPSVLVAALLGGALAACGGGGETSGGGSMLPSTNPSPSSSPAAKMSDDWTTYAHDYQRTGFERIDTGITESSVGQLKLAWRVQLDTSCVQPAQSAHVFVDEASPLVTNGLVYVADVCGTVAALSRDTGSVVWERHLPLTPGAATSGVYGTPTLADGTLFVPVWGKDDGACGVTAPQSCTDPAQGGYLAALDAAVGTLKWSTAPLARGNMRGEPIVINGRVFEGISGGDDTSGYVNGGLVAFDENTGTQIGEFMIAPVGGVNGNYDGGSSWSPISYDGRFLYFGTGNTRDDLGYQDSLVQLDPTTLAPTSYIIPTYDGDADEDIGGGALFWGADIYFTGKSGNFYGFSSASPSSALIETLINTNPRPGGVGGISTPTTDGNVIAASSGYNLGNYQSDLDIFTVGGANVKCKLRATNSSLYSYAAFVNGIGFTPLDNGVPSGMPSNGISGPAPWFVAFDDDCNVIWKANPTDVLQFFYAGPAVVQSGVYAVDVAGNVYSWKLPSMIPDSVARRDDLIRPAQRTHFIFGHFIPGRLPPHEY